MYKKLKKFGWYNLLPLLVMLYITVGMPLVHPLIHQHSDHDRSVSTCGSLLLQNIADEGKTHHCTICDFEATNQLHSKACNFVPDWHQAIDDFVFIKISPSLKAIPQSIEARAPPFPSAKA
ncbi:MAG: hypothetical protein PVI69_10455 [Desulfobacterales bacterium]|jgi:hypothetical protein